MQTKDIKTDDHSKKGDIFPSHIIPPPPKKDTTPKPKEEIKK